MAVFHNSVGLVIAEDNDFVHVKIAKRDDVAFDLKGGEHFVTLAFTGTDEQGLQLLPWEAANEVADNNVVESAEPPTEPEPADAEPEEPS